MMCDLLCNAVEVHVTINFAQGELVTLEEKQRLEASNSKASSKACIDDGLCRPSVAAEN